MTETFKFIYDPNSAIIPISITRYNYYNFKELIPWMVNESPWQESYPMKGYIYVNKEDLFDTVNELEKLGMENLNKREAMKNAIPK